ncbi:uncharacterized protein METZ01_LOCUS296610 [marine metagenome]|uniref:Uncharacterized protein n=1 Tax=marine metagenome TaxID=408172 RepID=A0A382M4F9_9ZZZZ
MFLIENKHLKTNITPFSFFPAVAHQEKPLARHAVLVFGERFRSENWDYLISNYLNHSSDSSQS